MFPRKPARVDEVQNVRLARAHPPRGEQPGGGRSVPQRRRPASAAPQAARVSVVVDAVRSNVAVARRAAAVLPRVVRRRVADAAPPGITCERSVRDETHTLNKCDRNRTRQYTKR